MLLRMTMHPYIFGNLILIFQQCLVELGMTGCKLRCGIFMKVLLYIISIAIGLNMLLVEGSISKCEKWYIDVIVGGIRVFPLKW